MSPRFEVLARCLGLSVLCLGLSLGCGDSGVSPRPPPATEGTVDAAASTVAVDKPTGVLANGTDQAAVTVTVLGKDGSRLSGRAVTVTVEGAGASIAVPPGQTGSNGEARALVVSTAPGVKTVKATVRDTNGLTVALTATATVEFVEVAPTASRLAFRQALPDGVAGTPLAGLEVVLQDATGAPVSTGTAEVTLSLASVGVVFPEGQLTVTTVDGVALFPEVVLKKAGDDYQFVANAPGFEPATSSTFKVLPGTPAAVGLSTLMESAVAGVAQDLQVTVQDAYFNTVTRYTGTVALTSTDAAASLPAAHVYTSSDAGRFTFTGITFKTAGNQRLMMDDGTSALSFTLHVNVSAGPPALLAFTQQPTRVSTREALGSVQVTLKDAFGNTALVDSPRVAVSLPQAGFTLSGTTEAAPVDGVATFTTLSVAGHGVTRLTASADGLPDASSADLTVVDDVAPAKPVLTQTASTETSLTVQWTGVGDDGAEGTLTAQELRYATTPIDSDAAFEAGTPVATGTPVPPGTVQTATLAGLAAGSTYHVALKVTDKQGNTTRSDSLTVSTADPQVTQLAFVTQPVDGTAGTALADVRVALLDARGDVVTTATSAVTLTLTDQAFFPAVTVSATSGVATFQGLRIDSADTFTLTATAGALGQQSQSFTVRAGPVSTLVLWQFSSPVDAGQALEAGVSLTDAFGNLARDYAGTVHFTSSDAQAVLPPDTTFTPADNGQKFITGLVFKTAGTQSLTATDTVTSDLTATVDADVRSIAAASFEVIAGTGPFTAGQALSYELVARDAYGNVATNHASTVTFSSTDAQAVLPGAYTFTLADAGRHVFSVELRTAGEQEVAAEDVVTASLRGTHTYSITPAAIDALAFVSAPTTGSVRQALADVQVALRDTYGNTVTDAATDVTLSLAGGGFSQGSPTRTPVDGVATFSGLVVVDEGTYRFEANAGGLPPSTSQDLVIADTVAPAIANGFVASELSLSSIRLDWAAPGDDGDLGTATRYEVRYATDAITEATFEAATVVTGVSAPQAPGTAESFTVSSLEVGTTYFFALKTFDGAGNGSALATASASTTNPCDDYVCTPPAPSCAEDGTSLEVYSSVCVIVAGEPTCEVGEVELEACPGADAVCHAGACATAPHPGAGELAISEVMHTPSAGTTEYVELTNTSTKLLDLNGMSVSFVDGVGEPTSFTLNHGHALVVDPGSRVVIAQNANFGTNGGVYANHAYGTNVHLDNSGSITFMQGATPVTSLQYTNAFPQTVGRAMSLASSIVGTAGASRPWYWCDSTGVLEGGDRGTPHEANDECGMNVEKPLNYCAIQYPKTFPTGDGNYPASILAFDPYDIFSQFYSFDVTTRNQTGNDFYPRIEAQLGYGTDSADPAGWTWKSADFNATYNTPGSNNDEVKAALSIPTAGTYRYGFRYRFTDAGAPWTYCDQNGVAVPPSGTYGSVTVLAGPQTDHVVISEFSGGTTANARDEFVELYNPTSAAVDLSGWQLSYKSATGTTYSTTYTIPAGRSIPSHGYFLLGGTAYAGSPAADVTHNIDASSSTTAGGHFRIQRLSGTVYVDVDRVGWGTGNAPEGTAAPSHPASGGSLERKAIVSSSSTTMAVGGAHATRGNGQDTDNNSADFVTRATRQPQSSASPVEFFH
ncbi:lamin tail domain-containing protein [Myxococcus qinghaiensis]|uniref:lamin tail domain-containing protein n=1 Tax=Myxococcus qinghaiensis TaxID=2906758 RepID=UPI0020A7A2B2|nr:lamin tail domain-containing protein [Myxococcus qinghaiensis]MCP3170135.1 lamin tail domain-containing protein [Myxococcus qinghaiensis]